MDGPHESGRGIARQRRTGSPHAGHRPATRTTRRRDGTSGSAPRSYAPPAAGQGRPTRSLAAHAEDVVQRVARAARAAGARCAAEATEHASEAAPAEDPAEDAAESTTHPGARAGAPAGPRARLPGHVAGEQHREHGEHL